jgi:hypothetical protein
MEKDESDEVRGRDGLEHPKSLSPYLLLMTEAEADGSSTVKQEPHQPGSV